MSSEIPAPSIQKVPKGGPYEGPVLELLKGKKKEIIESTKKLEPKGVIDQLSNYRDYIPGSDIDKKETGGTKNSFEMIALYQRALQILQGNVLVDVDTHFGKKTHQALLAFQKDVLGFTGKEADGLPGPKTTLAILDKLNARIPKEPAPVVEKVKQENPKMSTPSPTKTVPQAKGYDETTRLVNLSKQVKELKDLQKNPMENEQERVNNIRMKLMDPSAMSVLNNKMSVLNNKEKGNFYFGNKPPVIEYAIVKQGDGDTYVYDIIEKGKDGEERLVYLVNSSGRVVVVARTNSQGIMEVQKKMEGYTIERAIFMPTPVIDNK